ncbi:hypothetical protein BJV78DRAFT_637785 [Lactifluus subvellereus]|nr:hypothetical protein BJV78DRAFT_637785 [Lactifluus subvellereus]
MKRGEFEPQGDDWSIGSGHKHDLVPLTCQLFMLWRITDISKKGNLKNTAWTNSNYHDNQAFFVLFPNSLLLMATHRRLPKFKFRVLIIGRANAGKTSILQRVCHTTQSPTIYRGSKPIQLEPSMEVGDIAPFLSHY